MTKDAPKELTCPACKKKWEAVVSLDKEKKPPVAGDFILCVDCGWILVFREDMSLRLPVTGELTRLKEVNPTEYTTLMLASFYRNMAYQRMKEKESKLN